MDTKKTVTLFTVMILCVAVFFRVPVYAAYTGSPAVHKAASRTVSNVYIEVDLDQYYPVINAESGTYGAAETYTFVYYRITNNNNQAALVTNTGFTPQWVNAPYITGYETYTENLYMGYQGNSTGTWWVYGDGDYSYNSGIVVPPTSSVYCIGYIKTSNTVNGTTVAGTALSSVAVSTHNVTLGDYPYGSNGQQFQEVESLLNQIIAELQFSGTITAPNQTDYLNHSKAFQDTGFYSRFWITRQPSFVVTEDTEILSSTDYYQSGYKVIPIYYRVRTDDQYTSSGTNMTLKFDYPNLYTPLYLPKVSGVSYIVGDCVSQVFLDPILDQTDSTYVRVQLPFKYTEDGHGLLPYGNYFTSFVIYCICPIDVTPVFPSVGDWVLQNNNTFTAIEQGFYLQDTFYFRSIDINLAALLEAYSAQSEQNTEDLGDAHTAEQNYFEANSQALANSGVSNPNFEASDRTNINSAIAGNKNTFGLLWNAIGAWRNVYIYAAMMTLVTYLLRHRPWASAGFSKASHWFNRMSGGDQG